MRGPPRPSYGCHLPGGSASPTRGKNLSGFGPPNHPAQRLHLLRAPAKPTRFSHLPGRGRQDTQHHAFTMGGGPPNQHGLPTNGRGLHTTQHHVFTFGGGPPTRGTGYPPTGVHLPTYTRSRTFWMRAPNHYRESHPPRGRPRVTLGNQDHQRWVRYPTLEHKPLPPSGAQTRFCELSPTRW